MKAIDKIKNFFFAIDDDDDNDDEYEDETEETSEPVRPQSIDLTSHHEPEPDDTEQEPVPAPVPVHESPVSHSIERERDRDRDRDRERERPMNNSSGMNERTNNAGNGRRNKVVNIQTTAQFQVVLVKPSAFTDAKQIADHLIAKKTVVLNLETASPENKRRIIDFLVGVAYANGGSLKPVANLTYVITPYNVGFIGEDLVGELENNGVFI